MVIKIYPGFDQEFIEATFSGTAIPRNTDLYKKLGLNKTMFNVLSRAQKIKEVNKTFKEKSLTCHPDKGGDPVEWNLIKAACDTLKNDGERTNYENISSNSWWSTTTNNQEFRNKVIFELDSFRVDDDGQKYLPSELKNWRTVINAATSKTIQEINSYALRIKKIVGDVKSIIWNVMAEEKVNTFPARVVAEKFAGLESKDALERKYEDIVKEIERDADGKPYVDTDNKKRRQTKRTVEGLPSWGSLPDDEKTCYLNKIKCSLDDRDKGLTLSTVLNNIVEEVRKRIRDFAKAAPGKKKLADKKTKYIGKLWGLKDWDRLLEVREQEYLESKINS